MGWGECLCGCGGKTNLAEYNMPRVGLRKGDPKRWLPGHHRRGVGGFHRVIDPPNPSGLCLCGCGNPTQLARDDDPKRGIRKGEPRPWLLGHNARGIGGFQRLSTPPPNPSGLCLCGCGNPTVIATSNNASTGDVAGQRRRYLRGHYRRTNHLCLCGRKNVNARDPAGMRCADCLKRDEKFGLEPGEYDRLLIQQRGVCAICQQPQTNPRWKMLNVDHDHATGRVRGLLCNRCNMGLGYFERDPAVFDALKEYVNR